MGSPEGCRISPAYVATLRVHSYPLRVPIGEPVARTALRVRSCISSWIFRIVERGANAAVDSLSLACFLRRFRAARLMLPIRAVIDRPENNRCRSRHLSQRAETGPAVLRSPSLHVRARREPRCIVSPSIMAVVLLRVRRKRRIGSLGRTIDRQAKEKLYRFELASTFERSVRVARLASGAKTERK